jgi:hypothetical protein
MRCPVALLAMPAALDAFAAAADWQPVFGLTVFNWSPNKDMAAKQ